MRKWAPNAKLARSDTWAVISNMLPTQWGNYMTPCVYATVTGSGPATPGTTLRAWCGVTAAGTGVGYVGTTTKLYSTTDFSTFTDRSIGGGYTSVAVNWDFAQFGNFTLATNNVDQIQVRDATGGSAFANLGGSPPTSAKIIVIQSNAVLAFNINTGGNFWAASDVGNQANWTTGDAVAATPILHRPGPITAAVAFKDEIIVFKASSVYRMRYVGQPVVWTVELLSDAMGASNKDSVCVGDDVLFFVGSCGAFIYDGATFRGADNDNVGVNVNSPSTAPCRASHYFPVTKSVYFHAPAAQGATFGSAGAAFVYNRASDRWGWCNFYNSGSTTPLTTYVMVTGDPVALDATASSIFTDEAAIGLVDLSSNPCVTKGTGSWGDQGSTIEAYVRTGYLGHSGDADQFVSRVTPVLHAHALHVSAGVPTATQLIGTLGAVTSSHGAGGTTPSQSPVTSSTGQCRFDFTVNSKFWNIQVGSKVSRFEIEDIVIDSAEQGSS